MQRHAGLVAEGVRSLNFRHSPVLTFMVSVPVLSLQMQVVLPSVSTASRFLTSTFLAAMRFAVMVSATVTVESRPSGTCCHDDTDDEHEVLDPFATDSDADAEEDDAHRDDVLGLGLAREGRVVGQQVGSAAARAASRPARSDSTCWWVASSRVCSAARSAVALGCASSAAALSEMSCATAHGAAPRT